MAITTAICNSFRVEVLQALHDFDVGANVFKCALYTSAANLGATTTAYTTSGEIAGTGGYLAGGNTLTNNGPTLSGTAGIADFVDTNWPSSTITANGCLIYNSTNGNRAVVVLAFGGDKTSTSGDFTVVFPAADSANCVVRIT